MPIPVLNENQMTALKGVLNGGKSIDLTGGGGSSTRLPTMPEETEVVVKGSSYNGPFAVVSVGSSMVEIDGATITPSESGTVPAIMAKVSSGAIVIADTRISKGLTDSSIAIPENYSLYMLYYLSISTSAPYGSSAFAAISGSPPGWDDIVFTKLADNRGGVLKQVQHGEITNIGAYAASAGYASSAGYAFSAGYWGHFKVCFAKYGDDLPGVHWYTDGTTILRTNDQHRSDWITIDSHTGAASGALWIGNTFHAVAHDNSAGDIIKGVDHIPVESDWIPLTFNIVSGANVYIYEDGEDSAFKYVAIDKAIASESANEIFSSCFYLQIADIDVKYLYTWSRGGTSANVYEATIKQAHYGDIIYGGSMVINSSSIYSSTIINSSSFALEYKGHFCVSGAVESAGTPQEAFVATVYDGTNPNGNVAGEIIVGNTVSTAGKSSLTCPIGSSVYLIGTVTGNSVSVEYSACGAAPTVQANQFYTQLACNSGGTMTQMQYGDIVQPVKGGTATAGVTRLIAGANVSLNPATGTGEVTINVTGGTGGGGGSVNFAIATGIYVLTGSVQYVVYCPQATDAGGYTINQYDFTAPGTATMDALNAATGKSLVNTGQYDDDGNIMFVLPENPASMTAVDIRISENSTRVVVCSVDGLKIVDAGGGQQGTTNGWCDDQMSPGNHFLYVYMTDISGWPQYYDAYYNETYISQYITTDGGCWVRLDINN